MTSPETAPLESAPPSARASRFRWVIVGLLVTAMVFNYIDRQTLGLLKTNLDQEFHWRERDFAAMVTFFSAAYAVAYLFWGRLVDRLGAKVGFAVAFSIWTLGHIAHGLASSVIGFIAARSFLGVGEGGAFPAGTKAVAEWFPKKERALATGIFNSGGNIGAIVTPILVPAIVLTMGWRWAFIITGVMGFIWLPLWLLLYRKPEVHPQVNAAELAIINQDPPDVVHKIGWGKLLTIRETWAYAVGKLAIDPIWWIYLYWLPDFLHKRHGLDLKNFGPPLVVIYLMSDFGSIAGGWLSSSLLRRGLSLNAARKITLLVCALLVTPIAFASQVDSLWGAVAIIGLATAAHQGFSSNLLTLPSDVFPRSAVGSVIGIGGALGAVGAMVMSQYVGWVLEKVGTYRPIFWIAASVYLIGLLAVHLLSPKLAPAKV
jgi:ACS family hexuronate transporter-like MFS transporter